MNRIKFGTDGWRAIIGYGFTVENLIRVSLACSNWLLRKFKEPSMVISYDTRFGGSMFAETVAKVMASKGIKVYLSDRFTPTPALSLAVRKLDANLGVMITASHNSYEYSGFKLKSARGGPMIDDDLRDIENLINYENEVGLELFRLEKLIENHQIEMVNIENIYIEHIKANFDIELLSSSESKISVNPMHGSGQKILPAIFNKIDSFHNSWDFSFANIPPEPLERNLKAFMGRVKKKKDLKMGICLDGDADRIALLDEDGKYIDSHRIILLLIHFLAGYKNQKGIIVTGFSSTQKVETIASHYRLPVVRVKIGFKEISRHMQKDDVLVGGEESGGISAKGHIPERDGIWMALLIWQWMEESGKSLSELLKEVYELTGKFEFSRSDLKISKEQKQKIISNCQKGHYTSFGKYTILRTEDLDGFKYFLSDDSWVMIRPSGTEPVLRTYAEAATKTEADAILEETRKVLLES